MKLDFLIIGAQKSATTALFKYLEPHARIAMPAAKEAPLFTKQVSEAEVDAFMSKHFSGHGSKLKGKATPQYMCDDKIPARLKAHNPKLKLIAVLRDPIDRAWSQYRMSLRRETESRSFDNAVADLLAPECLALARAGKAPLHEQQFESECDYYLVWSEYGRILETYRKHFEREQLLVLYMDEIQRDPDAVLNKVLMFLGLPLDFRPDCLGEVIHKGGSEVVITNQLKSRIRHFGPVRMIWDRVPEARRQSIRYWFEQLNVRRSDEAVQLSPALRATLESHFAADAMKIAALTGCPPPWSQAKLQCA